MAKNNSQTGESPEETGANGEANTQANVQALDDAAKTQAEAEARAKEEAEAKARAEAETRAKEAAEAKAKAEAEAKARAEKTVPVQIRHKTEYPKYRCAGLLLTQKPETYEVTAVQLEKLERDPWVETIRPEGAAGK
jgi:membrane protein involved in colicin uptake